MFLHILKSRIKHFQTKYLSCNILESSNKRKISRIWGFSRRVNLKLWQPDNKSKKQKSVLKKATTEPFIKTSSFFSKKQSLQNNELQQHVLINNKSPFV